MDNSSFKIGLVKLLLQYELPDIIISKQATF